jgi:hypothetical protein
MSLLVFVARFDSAPVEKLTIWFWCEAETGLLSEWSVASLIVTYVYKVQWGGEGPPVHRDFPAVNDKNVEIGVL